MGRSWIRLKKPGMVLRRSLSILRTEYTQLSPGTGMQSKMPAYLALGTGLAGGAIIYFTDSKRDALLDNSSSNNNNSSNSNNKLYDSFRDLAVQLGVPQKFLNFNTEKYSHTNPEILVLSEEIG